MYSEYGQWGPEACTANMGSGGQRRVIALGHNRHIMPLMNQLRGQSRVQDFFHQGYIKFLGGQKYFHQRHNHANKGAKKFLPALILKYLPMRHNTQEGG